MTIAQPVIQFSCPDQSSSPVTAPLRDIRAESECTGYGKVVPPVSCTQSNQSPLQSPGSTGHLEPSSQLNQIQPFNPETSNFRELQNVMDENTHNASDQIEFNKRHKSDHLGDQEHSFSGILGHFNSFNSGSNDNANNAPDVKVSAGLGNEAKLSTHDGNCHRSIQREAALAKFRLKRKARCYGKKVYSLRH